MVASRSTGKAGNRKVVAAGPGAGRDEKVAGMVRRMSGMGLNRTEVGVVIGLKATEVEAIYGVDFIAGGLECVTTVRLVLYRAATDPRGPNLSACRLFLKAHREHYMSEAKEVAGHVSATMKRAKGGVPVRSKKEPELGKKAQAEVDAKTADQGTEWDGLLADSTA